MVLIIILDIISMMVSLLVFSLARSLRPSFEKLVTPLILIFYAAGVLVIALSILEITGFITADQSPAGIGIHLVILGIVMLMALGLNKLRIARIRNDLQEIRLLNRMKAEFLARTSHELKTPLTPLLLQLQMLKRGTFGEVNKQQKESIRMLERNIKRLSALLNDILFYSKSTAGKIKLDTEPTDLNKLIKETIKTIENEAKKKNIKIKFTEGKIPKIECDPNRITEVLVNILDNAVKFSQKDGLVEIETTKIVDYVQTSIKDHGIGVSPKNMKKLFTPFTQIAEVATRKQGGTGVGLSICKSLLDLHEGKIWAESEGENKGTAIYFALPAKNLNSKK